MKALTLATCAAALGLCATSASATARIEGLSVKGASAGAPATVVLNMNRATPLDLAPCDLVIDMGDGEKPLAVTFRTSDSKNKSVRYTYKKAGTYKVVAKGAGKSACEGERAAEVKVGKPAVK